MLKLTKTGIGLLTRQYRSVLKKCLLINLGVFAINVLSSQPAIALTEGSSEGENSFAIGGRSIASGYSATAVGGDTKAVGYGTTAVGLGARALAMYAVGIGRDAHALSDYSVALGGESVARGSVVSVGHLASDLDYAGGAYGANLFRKIINVAEGSDANDAVTVSQLGSIAAGTKILNPNGTSAISFGTNTGQITVGTAIARIANELDNNYYRKDEKSEILNGFEEGKIGNEIGDNFSQLAANDNFAITTFLRAI